MDHEHIIAASLFVASPQSNSASAQLLLDMGSLENADIGRLIESSYHMLREHHLSKEDAFKVWEMRLMLLLFNDQLGAAKKEALNLNNALYIHENPGAALAKLPAQLLSRPQEGGFYLKLASPTGSSTSLSQAGVPPKVVVYPLPNNSDSSLPDLLMRLLLRLKSLPNLSLVNEIYKLSYQYRLRSSAHDGHKLQAKLICSAYATASVLIINKNYISLLSLTESICGDLEHVLKETNAQDFRRYISNISMIWVWAKALSYKHRKLINLKSDLAERITDEHVSAVVGMCESMFQKVDDATLMALKFVVGKLTQDNSALEPEDWTIYSIVRGIFSDTISTRIMCCTLSVWDIEATYNGRLTETNFEVAVEEGSTPLEVSYAKIISKWGDNFNKLYGME